jgi:hypothetical protein
MRRKFSQLRVIRQLYRWLWTMNYDILYVNDRCCGGVILALYFLDLTNKRLKLAHYTPRRRLGERRYSSCSFSTSALDGINGQSHAPEKGPPVPTVQEAGWAPEPVWTQEATGETLSPVPGIEPQSPGHPARSQTLYWATRLTDLWNTKGYYQKGGVQLIKEQVNSSVTELIVETMNA